MGVIPTTSGIPPNRAPHTIPNIFIIKFVCLNPTKRITLNPIIGKANKKGRSSPAEVLIIGFTVINKSITIHINANHIILLNDDFSNILFLFSFDSNFDFILLMVL